MQMCGCWVRSGRLLCFFPPRNGKGVRIVGGRGVALPRNLGAGACADADADADAEIEWRVTRTRTRTAPRQGVAAGHFPPVPVCTRVLLFGLRPEPAGQCMQLSSAVAVVHQKQDPCLLPRPGVGMQCLSRSSALSSSTRTASGRLPPLLRASPAAGDCSN